MSLIKNRRLAFVSGAAVILTAIALTLFRHWEMSGETWGYWFFARVFAETGRFILIDRSPLYTLYLNAFRWMGYPNSVIAEFIVTSSIAVISFIALFKRYLGFLPAVFAALAWLPYLQAAEPPVQMLALSCSCLGVVARLKSKSSSKIVSYSFFMLAYLFRPSYFIMLIIFGVWDTIKSLENFNLKTILNLYNPKYSLLPLAIVIGLFIWFVSAQSTHPFNNVAITSTMWFPYNDKSLRDGAFIQNYNWKYIEVKYGDFKNKDFYYTNQELFGGAKTAFDAILHNPKFVTNQIGRNIKDAVLIVSSLTIMGTIRSLIGGAPFTGIYSMLIAIIGLFAGIAVLYGAFRASRNESVNLFIISNLLLVGVATIFLPKPRYMVPMALVLTFSAHWYSSKVNKILPKFPFKYGKLIFPLILILIFSNGVAGWGGILADITQDVKYRNVRILENEEGSIKQHFTQLNDLIKKCNGVLSLEHNFIGAFMEIPIDKVYDVYEIPPFGSLGNPIYKGLEAERVGCVIVSNTLATETGKGTNIQLRYDNYIKPYAENLKKNGARVHYLENFGYMLALPKSKGN